MILRILRAILFLYTVTLLERICLSLRLTIVIMIIIFIIETSDRFEVRYSHAIKSIDL